ncbi:hypothetical protein CcCBS67573_g00214 [Chytriomyces confervae]|uniref:Amidohydrolase 3 domain-containing protein n=1 Tax=Chytriomyces confervae TaxID=246404 RepID=A0A507FVF3_9FUNG|nr:hypothetical protein HDU80_003682 [Chytriomyces hyalinus]TPX78517.1 hypothetical protein CcCBS67573_g00214 [Chytriomyces confervae]
MISVLTAGLRNRKTGKPAPQPASRTGASIQRLPAKALRQHKSNPATGKWTLYIAIAVVLGQAALAVYIIRSFSHSGASERYLVHNAVIYSYTGSETELRAPFDAFVVGSDGKFEAVGSSVELKQSFWHLNQFDARGAMVVPGLIDTHLNLVEHGQSILNANLRNAKSVKECLSRLIRHLNGNADIEGSAQSGESRKWLLGFGWDHSIWTDRSGKFPTKRDLDSHPRLKNVPIALFNSDNTAVWCNAAALSLTSITRHTQPLKGGEIIVDDATGEPTGVLVGPAQMLIRNALSQRFSQDRENAILSATKAVLAKGITAVYDVDSAIQCSVSTCDSLPAANEIIKKANDYLSAESVHLTLDGGLSTWSSLLHGPYSDDPDSTGHSFISVADLEAVLLKALGKGYHASLQCEGDAAVSQALNVLEQVSKLHSSNWTNRIRLSGMSCFRTKDVDRLASLGVAASIQPAVSLNGKQKGIRLGSGRVKAVEQAWKRMSEKRVRVRFGGGGDAMGIVYAATANEAGETWTRQQVLDGMTRKAAMSGDKMGRIEKGYFADFGMYKQDWVKDEENGGVVGDVELVGMEAAVTVVGGVVRHGEMKYTR